MDITLLKYFMTVAQLQHISKAAMELNISQSALSANIAKLESELGVQLFDRQGRGIRLNALGEQYYQDIRSAVYQIDMAGDRLRRSRGIQNNRLTIVAPPMFTFPDLMPYIQKCCPHVVLSYVNVSYSELHDKLLSGQVDLCILGRPISDSGLHCTVVHQDEMVMLVPSNHPYAQAGRTSLTNFRNENFADYPNMASVQSERDQICRAANFTPHITFEANTMHDIIEAVRAGNHVALLPREVLSRYNARGTAVVTLEEQCNNRLRMYVAEENRRDVVLRVSKAIVNYFKNI